MGAAGLLGVVFEGLSGGVVAALAVGGAAALTGLYFLKPRRRAVAVAFAPLWFGAAGERRAERWARRVRRWLSLALQLAIFGLLLVAAAAPRPRAGAEDGAGRTVVVLVDRSLSMSATDEPNGRLGTARARARAQMEALGAGDRALVASFAGDVAAESGFEPGTDTGQARLARALDRIAPTEEPGDLPGALAFATSLLHGKPHPTIWLVSDGGFTDDARAQVAAAAGIDVRWIQVGRRGHNVAILSFAARPLPADVTTIEATVTLRNNSSAPAPVVLEIVAGEARAPVDRVRLTLAPGETRRRVIPDLASPDPRLEAQLVDHVDDLALDDRAYAVVPTPRVLRVLQVGPRDLYLEGALLSLGARVVVERVAVTRVAPDDVDAARFADHDVVIFDGVAPAPAPTSGHFLYLAPRGPGSPFVARGAVRAPVISDAKRTHPLLRQIDLTDLNVAEADRLVLTPGDVAVASSFGAPLVVARERPGLRIAALAFELRRSDLPLRPAFPLFIANALTWLSGTAAQDALPAVVGGAVARAGFVRTGATLTAANLGDARESDLAPPPSLVLGGRPLAPPDAPAGKRRPALATSTSALLAAIALLLAEWVSSMRRWTV